MVSGALALLPSYKVEGPKGSRRATIVVDIVSGLLVQLKAGFFIWAGGYWFWGQKKRQIGDKIFFQYFFPNLLV